jgi:hypothetical protein
MNLIFEMVEFESLIKLKIAKHLFMASELFWLNHCYFFIELDLSLLNNFLMIMHHSAFLILQKICGTLESNVPHIFTTFIVQYKCQVSSATTFTFNTQDFIGQFFYF